MFDDTGLCRRIEKINIVVKNLKKQNPNILAAYFDDKHIVAEYKELCETFNNLPNSKKQIHYLLKYINAYHGTAKLMRNTFICDVLTTRFPETYTINNTPFDPFDLSPDNKEKHDRINSIISDMNNRGGILYFYHEVEQEIYPDTLKKFSYPQHILLNEISDIYVSLTKELDIYKNIDEINKINKPYLKTSMDHEALKNKIRWNNEENFETFKLILLNIKEKIIEFNNIDDVLACKEKARFIGRNVFRNAVFLFDKLEEMNFLLPIEYTNDRIVNNFHFECKPGTNIRKKLSKYRAELTLKKYHEYDEKSKQEHEMKIEKLRIDIFDDII